MTVLNVTNAALKGALKGPTFTGDCDGTVFTGTVTYTDTTTPPPADAGKITGFNAATGSSFKVGTVTFSAQNANKGWSLTKPDDYTLRCETRVGDLWTAGDNTSRSELSGDPHYQNGGVINLNFKVTVEPGSANTADWLCINQMHATTQGPPPYALEMQKEKMAIVLRYQKQGQSAATDMYPWTDTAAVQRGKTYDMKIESKYDPTGGGYLRAWRDGVQVVNYSGPLGVHSAEYYFKYGIYRSKSAGETFAVKFANMDVTTA